MKNIHCKMFGHDLEVAREVTYHVKEYTCKNCRKEFTTSSNGKSNVPMRLGVIAQEVQKAIPEAVSESNTQQGYLGVDYFKLVPILIEALRELVDRLKVVETIQSKKSQEMQNNNNHINTTISKGQLFKVFKALLKEEEELIQEHDKLTTRIDHLYKKIPSL